jgi:hypothetical protein
MKFLISLWKFLSVPVLLLAAWLGWWGWKNWPAASALSRPVGAEVLERHKDGVFFVRDSFDFAITDPGLRQENNYGIKGPALAVLPIRPTFDTATVAEPLTPDSRRQPPARYGLVSDEPRFVGPSIATFLRSDSMAIVDIRVSSTTSEHSGNVGPQMQALIQITADKLGHGPLALPRSGRAFIEGIARMRTAEQFADLADPAPEVWEIRTGKVHTLGTVVFAFVGAVLLVGLFVLFNLVARNYDRAQLEKEMEELENEQPLV